MYPLRRIPTPASIAASPATWSRWLSLLAAVDQPVHLEAAQESERLMDSLCPQVPLGDRIPRTVAIQLYIVRSRSPVHDFSAIQRLLAHRYSEPMPKQQGLATPNEHVLLTRKQRQELLQLDQEARRFLQSPAGQAWEAQPEHRVLPRPLGDLLQLNQLRASRTWIETTMPTGLCTGYAERAPALVVAIPPGYCSAQPSVGSLESQFCSGFQLEAASGLARL